MIVIVMVAVNDHNPMVITIFVVMTHDDNATMVIAIPVVVADADADADADGYAFLGDHHGPVARCRRSQRRRAQDCKHARDES
jgi:hypothetical protein